MLELRFHPKETSELTTIHPNENAPAVYVSRGTAEKDGDTYSVVDFSFYFQDNLAIGLGWRLFPRSPFLGYHPHDIEHVAIYSGTTGRPAWVYFSAHSLGQGTWQDASDCEFTQEGHLVVYIARNSHACYPRKGTYLRCFGFANDVCSDRGLHQVITANQLLPSYDFVFPNGIHLSTGLRPTSGTSVTPIQRFLTSWPRK